METVSKHFQNVSFSPLRSSLRGMKILISICTYRQKVKTSTFFYCRTKSPQNLQINIVELVLLAGISLNSVKKTIGNKMVDFCFSFQGQYDQIRNLITLEKLPAIKCK